MKLLPAPGTHRVAAVLVGLAWGLSAAAEAPSASRAERTRELRGRLEEARRALELERLGEARRAFADVLERAERYDRGSLLVARAADGLADVERLQGNHAEAIPLYERSARLWEDLLGPAQPRLATTLHNLALSHLASGDAQAAHELLRRSLRIWEASLGGKSPQAIHTRRAMERARRLLEARG